MQFPTKEDMDNLNRVELATYRFCKDVEGNRVIIINDEIIFHFIKEDLGILLYQFNPNHGEIRLVTKVQGHWFISDEKCALVSMYALKIDLALSGVHEHTQWGYVENVYTIMRERGKKHIAKWCIPPSLIPMIVEFYKDKEIWRLSSTDTTILSFPYGLECVTPEALDSKNMLITNIGGA